MESVVDMRAYREGKYKKASGETVSESSRKTVSSESVFERLSLQDKKRVLALFWFLIQKNKEVWERGKVLLDEKNVECFEREIFRMKEDVFCEKLQELIDEWGSGSAKLKASLVWDSTRAEYAVALLRKSLGLF